MSITSIDGSKVLPESGNRKFTKGDYVFDIFALAKEPNLRDLMQVRGYNTWGYVLVHFVRHKHRKYVPWHEERERDLVAASDFGFYASET